MKHPLQYRSRRGNAPLVPRAVRELKWGMLAAFSLLPAAAFGQQAGDLDAGFASGGQLISHFGPDSDEAYAVAVQADGKLVVTGYMTNPSLGSPRFGVARYLSDGTPDTSFGGDGLVTTDFDSFSVPQAVAVQADGKIIVGGYTDTASALARYLSDGTPDVTFSGDGKLTSTLASAVSELALQPDGKIVAAGGFGVVRYLPDGTPDPTFGSGGAVTSDIVQKAAVVIQSNGKIVAAGQFYDSASSQYRFAIERLLPNGAADTSFGVNGLVLSDAGGDGSAGAVALQSDGKIVSAGTVLNFAAGRGIFTVLRHRRNGSLDTTFSGDGRAVADFGEPSQATAVAIQRDGKIVVAGFTVNFALARFLPDGTLDTTFSGDGLVVTPFDTSMFASSFVTDTVIQPDGRIVAAGGAYEIRDGISDFALARYESGLPLQHGPPTTGKECRNDGWRTFNVPRTFVSERDCKRFVRRN